MDSLASVEVPAIGYVIRYEFGIFDQTIVDGWQCEITDKWLKFGNAWCECVVESPAGMDPCVHPQHRPHGQVHF